MTTASSRLHSAEPPAQLALAEDLAPTPAGSSPDMTIGEVLTALSGDFPELTISKIRYYERQGLLRPARSASGYRKFTPVDVARLQYVLTAARDQYLPLKVIKERLEAADVGRAAGPPEIETSPTAAQESQAPPHPSGLGVGPELFDLDAGDERLTRRELMRDSGLDNEQLSELEAYGLLAPGAAARRTRRSRWSSRGSWPS